MRRLINTFQSIIKHPLNKNCKIRSFVDFIKWQIGSRLVPGDVIYNWINGVKIIVRPGERGLTQNLYCGLHEFPEMSFLLHVLKKEDFFVDVGANVGSYTLLAGVAIGARGIAFEPVPSNYSRLVDNIGLNNIEENRISCMNMGVGDKCDEIRFTANQNTMNHVVRDGEQQLDDVLVKVTTLDSSLKAEKPNMLKIDVEGYEMPVLMGARRVLENEALHSIIIELNGNGEKYGFDESNIISMLDEYGFKPYSYDPFSRNLQKLDGKNMESENTLFIRKEEYVVERLKSSPKFIVNGLKI